MLRRQVVDVSSAAGMLLSDPVFHPTGKKLLAKGHLLNAEDIQLLTREGYLQIPVNVLEDGDVPEEEAAVQLALQSACGSLEIRIGAGGRANLVATESCCVLVDEERLRQLNCSGIVTAATLPNLSFAFAEQRIATIKSAPFGVPRPEFERERARLEEAGPLVHARPVGEPAVGVLYSDPFDAERARRLFEGIMRTRLERFGVHAAFVLAALEEEEVLARSLQHLLRARRTMRATRKTSSLVKIGVVPLNTASRKSDKSVRVLGSSTISRGGPSAAANDTFPCWCSTTPLVPAMRMRSSPCVGAVAGRK